MKPAPVTLDVSLMLVRRYLKGFKGYPRDEQGEENFARCVQDTCLSVSHAEAVLSAFGGDFPQKNHIIESANSLRDRFAPKHEPRELWESQYGKPDDFKLYPPDAIAMHWQALRDCLYYTEGPGELQLTNKPKELGFWMDALRYNEKCHAESLQAVRKQIGAQGWPAIMALTASPVPFPYVSPLKRERNTPAPGPALRQITEADIEAARKDVPLPPPVDPPASDDDWDDPDR